MEKNTKYPIGIQTFPKLIESGYSYIDKTEYIYKIVKSEGYFFLSRPRRFGKSLLLSTIHAYFEGRRELFKGLDISRHDIEWVEHPVFHFDLNIGDYMSETVYTIFFHRALQIMRPYMAARAILKTSPSASGILLNLHMKSPASRLLFWLTSTRNLCFQLSAILKCRINFAHCLSHFMVCSSLVMHISGSQC